MREDIDDDLARVEPSRCPTCAQHLDQILVGEQPERLDLNRNLPRNLDLNAPLQVQRRAPVDPWCLNRDVWDAIYQAVNGTPGPMPVGEVERR